MAKSFKLQFVETIATLMTAAFGMIAALAWNTAISALIAKYFPNTDDTVVPLLIYAIFITIVAVICIILIARTLGNLKEKIAAEEEAKK